MKNDYKNWFIKSPNNINQTKYHSMIFLCRKDFLLQQENAIKYFFVKRKQIQRRCFFVEESNVKKLM